MAKASVAEIRAAILDLLPVDGSTMGNGKLRELIARQLAAEIASDDYFAERDALVQSGQVVTGMGRGGSVRRVLDAGTPLALQSQHVPATADVSRSKKPAMTIAQARQAKTGAKGRKSDEGAQVIAYQHDQKRRNNPDVGAVTPETDPDQPKTTWAYDPHIDPALQFDSSRGRIEKLIDEALEVGTERLEQFQQDLLGWIDHALAGGDEAAVREVVHNLRKRVEQGPAFRPEREALEQLKREAAPYLNWTGKAERTSFDVDTVSLHVHERIDPTSILSVVRKRMQHDKGEHGGTGDMFRAWFEEPLPYREAIEFYKHDRGWANRLVAGDSLLVMNSLLQKESMAGQVQMIYIDPPYGIKYGSNFQPFVNRKPNQTIDKEEDLTIEPEMIRAFRDTWELGNHSYLTYLRDRLILARELLHASGSIFVQISDENMHWVRAIMDEVFGVDNFMNIIAYRTKIPLGTKYLASTYDYIVWFAKDTGQLKFHKLYDVRKSGEGTQFNKVRLPSLEEVPFRDFDDDSERLPAGASVFRATDLVSSGLTESCVFDFYLDGKKYSPKSGKSWKTNPDGMERAIKAKKILHGKTMPSYRFEFSDFPVQEYANVWTTTQGASDKGYVVETSDRVIERCMLMTTDPGDLVLDPTCGGGTTAYVAEKWGRRWVTCDTSRVAVTLAKQRLMTASYDYYELKYPHEGLRGGFIYKTVPHVTLKSIANNPDIDAVFERMQPVIEQALGKLNATLKSAGAPLMVTEGGRKGKTLDFAKADALQEWEVPFEFPADWKPVARDAFDGFHATRQAMQRKMDESIAAHADQETLYDQPAISKDKLRITGPFTVEAVPFPNVLSLQDSEQPQEADASIARSGESLRQHTWRDELLKTGIRGKGGQMLEFTQLETQPDTRYLHCTGHTDAGDRVVVSFGPEHGALEQKQVELAMREAGDLFPRPKMIVFCAFTFDPEAAKDIDATKGITALKVQMNTDLLTEDLKKQARSNQSFWLMGQPEVELRQLENGKYEVEVNGFDYFDTTNGELKSGGKKNIAAWSLDTDYDERSLFPRQVFFPMAGAKEGWNKLKKSIKAELDESRLETLHGTVSLPFEPGENQKIAVKIVDDRGIESLKVMALS